MNDDIVNYIKEGSVTNLWNMEKKNIFNKKIILSKSNY